MAAAASSADRQGVPAIPKSLYPSSIVWFYDVCFRKPIEILILSWEILPPDQKRMGEPSYTAIIAVFRSDIIWQLLVLVARGSAIWYSG